MVAGVITLNNCFPNRIASLSKIFPTLMLYKLWEEGKVASLDDPLEKYAANFTIKNPLGKRRGVVDVKAGSDRDTQPRSPSVTLRRMAGQLSGEGTLPLHGCTLTLAYLGHCVSGERGYT